MRERGSRRGVFHALTLIQSDFLQESQVSTLETQPLQNIISVSSLVGQRHSVVVSRKRSIL